MTQEENITAFYKPRAWVQGDAKRMIEYIIDYVAWLKERICNLEYKLGQCDMENRELREINESNRNARNKADQLEIEADLFAEQLRSKSALVIKQEQELAVLRFEHKSIGDEVRRLRVEIAECALVMEQDRIGAERLKDSIMIAYRKGWDDGSDPQWRDCAFEELSDADVNLILEAKCQI